MKAIFQHSITDESKLTILNQFLGIVERAEYPLDLVCKLYGAGLLPGGLVGTGCEIKVRFSGVFFMEYTKGDWETIVFVPSEKVEI